MGILLASCVPEDTGEKDLKFKDLKEREEEGDTNYPGKLGPPLGETPTPIGKPPTPSGGEPSPAPSKGTIPGKYVSIGAMDIRHGDRFYIASTIRSIFGPESESIANDQIKNKLSLFGGICDRYRDKDCDLKTNNTRFSYSNTARSGMMTKVCEDLVNRNATIDFFLNRNGLTRSSNVSAASIEKQYRLFYPKQIPSSEYVAKLMEVKRAILVSDDSWRVITLAICLSPGWLIP